MQDYSLLSGSKKIQPLSWQNLCPVSSELILFPQTSDRANNAIYILRRIQPVNVWFNSLVLNLRVGTPKRVTR